MYEVAFEGFVLQCEVTDLINADPSPGTWTSDWDAQGYRELEFRVVSGVVYDENDRPSDLGRNGCAELSEKYAEFIESELWRQIDAQSHDVA
ncbi:hypothetical protein M5G27_29500 [Pseudomonas shahriarae]|uniref:Uncharacterized protein n=1 Tax=Pseudomonas shahriarae TaxID=2745512 RepID=A0A9X4HG80_9PSED|nr:hypothetical protein [Pseudomonas shahriarae]MDD1011599.1 hypothetical protein [Pseudomonas shahriarae]